MLAQPSTRLLANLLAQLLAFALAAGSVAAHGAGPGPGQGPLVEGHGAATLAALHLQPDPAPMSARYAVTITPARAGRSVPAGQHDWYFHRDRKQVALLKGNIDEAWHRNERGHLRFERVFHEDGRAVDYSTGELLTLNVHADWTALSSFIDPRDLLNLRVQSRTGRGAEQRLRLVGVVGGESWTVDWLPALQLPARLVRSSRERGVIRLELKQQASVAPLHWPRPGARSADYLRLDAADFGDMDYETVVRKSEALDIRLGWRTAHAHD